MICEPSFIYSITVLKVIFNLSILYINNSMNFTYLAMSSGTFVVAYMSGSVEMSRQRQFIGLCLIVMSYALVYCQGTVFLSA
jgi:hypothetical protein